MARGMRIRVGARVEGDSLSVIVIAAAPIEDVTVARCSKSCLIRLCRMGCVCGVSDARRGRLMSLDDISDRIINADSQLHMTKTNEQTHTIMTHNHD